MAATILYLNFHSDEEKHRRKLAGIRRFAKTRGWTVTAVPPEESRPEDIKKLLARFRPVGCVVECTDYHNPDLPPRLFGKTPVVHLDPPEKLRWHSAATVVCDNEAVAGAAFAELMAGHPAACAVVTSHCLMPWSEVRAAAFRTLCDQAGVPCRVFRGPREEEVGARILRLKDFISQLPRHTAIFAANDWAALHVAEAARLSMRDIPRELTLVGVDGMPETGDTNDLASPLVSSVEIDFELAGFLAGRMLGERIKGRVEREIKGHAGHEMKGRAEREMNGATYTANSKASSFAPKAHTSFGGKAATLNSHEVRPSLHSPPPCGECFGPLLVLRRKSTSGRGRREPRILEAVEMIRREACDGLTSAKLAARFPVSRQHFERRFLEAMGHTVLNEIIHVRLQAVMDMLARPEPPIGAIADFCGFGSQVELRIIFKKRMGMSLRQWRQSHL